MLFHKFRSQDERRAFGGSSFIEIQYCRLPQGTPVEGIVSVDGISHWKDDSLYVSDDNMEAFYRHYGNILTDGIYNNGERGPMDLCGINFYSREQAAHIMERLQAETPPDYPLLLDWLQAGTRYIGFYLLGL